MPLAKLTGPCYVTYVFTDMGPDYEYLFFGCVLFCCFDALQVATNHHGLPRANHAVVAPYPGALHTTRSDVVINNHTEKRFMRKRGKQETVLLPAAAYHFYHSILSRFSVAFHFLMSMIRGCRDSGVCTSIIRILRVSGSQDTVTQGTYYPGSYIFLAAWTNPHSSF